MPGGHGHVPSADATADRLASVSGLMASVSTAYTAAHGHPLDHDGLVARQVRRRRWSVGVRAAVVGSLAVALVTGVVVVRDLARTSGAPLALTEVDPTAGSPADPVADPTGDQPEDETDGQGGAGDAGATSGEAGTGATSTSAAGPQPAAAAVAVHVVGQVATPGVVQIAAGSRVIDAITAAGGLTETADAGAVNLARAVVDGEQIYVPAPGETVPTPAPAGQAPAGVTAGSGASGVGAPGAGAPGAGAPGTGGAGVAINLNTADAAALDTLPGIGPALAGRIIDWREAHGRFAALEDLLEVSGIGPAVLAKIRDQVTV